MLINATRFQVATHESVPAQTKGLDKMAHTAHHSLQNIDHQNDALSALRFALQEDSLL